MLEWLGMPVAGSAHAGEVDQIMVLVHWLMLVLFVGWSVFFVYVLVRFRRRAHPVASYDGLRGRWSTWVEGGVLVAEIAAAGVLLDSGLERERRRLPPEAQSTVVRVVAEQFAWNVHYPGADGRFGRTDLALLGPTILSASTAAIPPARDDITTINQLYLPVNKPVIVHLSSKDMVHSFALPQMRVKQDAIPGIAQPVWFTPTQTGQWEIACSQLCGLGHYRMRGFYTIQTQAEYDAWLAEETALLAAP